MKRVCTLASRSHEPPGEGREPERRDPPRLAAPPKKKVVTLGGTADGIISLDEFMAMGQVQRAIIPAYEDHDPPIVLTVGDDVNMYSPGYQTDNSWVAKVVDIRQTPEEGPYFLVKWYYSARDIVQHIVGYYHNSVPRPDLHLDHDYILDNLLEESLTNERFLTEEMRILQWQVMNKRVIVYPYDESKLDVVEFSEKDFFTRRSYDIEEKLVVPPLLDTYCRICHNEPYQPFPDDIAAPTTNRHKLGCGTPELGDKLYDPWHFCPRLGCRIWFHRRCLLAGYCEYNIGMFAAPRPIRLLAGDPDSNRPHPAFAPFISPLLPKKRSVHAAKQPWNAVLSKLKHLPPALVRLAQQPIIKCSGMGKASICGNLKDVVIARKICYQELDGGVEDLVEEMEALRLLADEEDPLKLMYDAFRSQRKILASPYVPYWSEMGRKGIPDDSSFPIIKCPICNSPI